MFTSSPFLKRFSPRTVGLVVAVVTVLIWTSSLNPRGNEYRGNCCAK